MNLFVLRYDDEIVIGAFNSKEKAQEAIKHYAQFKYFSDPQYFFIEEIETNKYYDEEYILDGDEEEEETSSSQSFKDRIRSFFIYTLIILFFSVIVLGIASLGQIIAGVFR